MTKRRTVKDADAEIVALKRELIEARTQVLTLTGQVTRLEEQFVRERDLAQGEDAQIDIETLQKEIEAAWEATGIKEGERTGSLAEAVESEITGARKAGEEAAWESAKEDAAEAEQERERMDSEREAEREAMLAALGMSEVEWDRMKWRWAV